ncbi:hypothetical protein [Nocardiopsis sp. NRRL B-16309]|nr:hypothetical protein [Nocardiopsis sp. NRRL B-16309]
MEDTYRWWVAHGEPEWSAFGATGTPEEQFVWHGSPVDGRRWPLA